MSEIERHSLVLARDCRVDDVESIWSSIAIGVRHPNSVREVLRSSAVFELSGKFAHPMAAEDVH